MEKQSKGEPRLLQVQAHAEESGLVAFAVDGKEMVAVGRLTAELAREFANHLLAAAAEIEEQRRNGAVFETPVAAQKGDIAFNVEPIDWGTDDEGVDVSFTDRGAAGTELSVTSYLRLRESATLAACLAEEVGWLCVQPRPPGMRTANPPMPPEGAKASAYVSALVARGVSKRDAESAALRLQALTTLHPLSADELAERGDQITLDALATVTPKRKNKDRRPKADQAPTTASAQAAA